MPQPEKTYTLQQIAELCQVSERTVRRWIDDKQLYPMRLGMKLMRVSDTELQRFFVASRVS